MNGLILLILAGMFTLIILSTEAPGTFDKIWRNK